ncbi:MAG: 2Fe-2S iron-sulfur cluster-binding protein [Candidatus Micrarchaeota archaeon]
MATVKIRNDNVEFEIPDGGFLKDYANGETAMLFGCQRGNCGTCICSIIKGEQNVNKKTQKEELTINKLGLPNGSRLACQIQIMKGNVEIEY